MEFWCLGWDKMAGRPSGPQGQTHNGRRQAALEGIPHTTTKYKLCGLARMDYDHNSTSRLLDTREQ